MDTSIPNLQSLAARVEMLEKQYRWLKSEVVTESFVLVDGNGKVRAALLMSEGVPRLILRDTNGNDRAVLKVEADGPFFQLLDPKTKAGLALATHENGPVVCLIDTNGKRRLTLDISPFESGTPRLVMYNANEHPTVCVTACEDGPSVHLSDPANADGNTSVQVTMGSEGPSLVCVKEGKVLWSAP